MKKLLALMLCLIMSLSFAACGSSSGSQTTTKKSTSTTAVTTTAAAPAVKEYTDKIEVPQFTLKINGKNYTQADFSGLKLYSCEATSINSAGTESTIPYIGYKASDVLAKAGVTGSYTKVICTASDAYEKDFTNKVFSQDTTLIAISKDDEIVKDGVVVAPCSSNLSADYVKKVATIVTQ